MRSATLRQMKCGLESEKGAFVVLAGEREFLRPSDRVGFLGIGSGLNCLMLRVDW